MLRLPCLRLRCCRRHRPLCCILSRNKDRCFPCFLRTHTLLRCSLLSLQALSLTIFVVAINRSLFPSRNKYIAATTVCFSNLNVHLTPRTSSGNISNSNRYPTQIHQPSGDCEKLLSWAPTSFSPRIEKDSLPVRFFFCPILLHNPSPPISQSERSFPKAIMVNSLLFKWEDSQALK